MQYIILILLFLILPALGFQEIGKGNIVEGILYLLPLLCLIAYLTYYIFNILPKEKLSEAACKKYHLPDSFLIQGDSWKWEKSFQSVIEKALEKETDPEKIKEIQICQNIVQNIHKDPLQHYSGFSNMDRAFYLTGCHIKITNDKGETIVQIV